MDNRTKEIVSGAIYDFMGYLTTRKERLILSATDNAAPAADITEKFLKLRGIDVTIIPDIYEWHTYRIRRVQNTTVITEWIEYTGSDEQIEELKQEQNKETKDGLNKKLS